MTRHIEYHKYKNYSAEDLLQDDYFILSGTNPTEESDGFWEEVLRTGNVSRENYDLACFLLCSLQIKPERLFPDEADRLWENIRHTCAQVRQRKKSRRRKLLFLWLPGSVASVILALFLYGRHTEAGVATPADDSIRSAVETVKAPDEPADEIRLILTNEEVVAVDGAEADIVHDGEGIAINSNDRKRIKKPAETGRTVYNQLIVPNGKRSMLALEDGSRMWINAGTRVVYPASFAADRREIYIDGEAYLEIARDETRPFTVKSENFSIDILGTSFNIMAYRNDDSHHVVLVSGSVTVRRTDSAGTVLSPDEMYVSENGNARVETVNVEYFTSWKTGMYQYRSERLDVILKRLSRYYGKSIVCMPEVAHLKCSGKLDLKDDLNSVLKGIAHTAPVKYLQHDDNYTVTNK